MFLIPGFIIGPGAGPMADMGGMFMLSPIIPPLGICPDGPIPPALEFMLIIPCIPCNQNLK